VKVLNAPQHVCIPHLLEDWAARTPDAPALVAPGRAPLTYGRLRRHIDDVVQMLHVHGIMGPVLVSLVAGASVVARGMEGLAGGLSPRPVSAPVI